MKNNIILLLIMLLLPAAGLLAQVHKPQYVLSGKVVTTDSSSLEAHLFDLDSKLLKTELLGPTGEFRFEGLGNGSYYVKIRRHQSDIYNSKVFEIRDRDLLFPEIHISDKRLETVVIARTRPYIERQDGKLILNVESSLQNTGGSAFDVLEKAPGVNIDANDNISLRGKNNLLIQIDGKNIPLTADALADYLRGISASAIEKIEFITNPSSKYDAAGTAIVNIKLKKGTKKGTNATVTTAIGTGRYIKNSNSFHINHRKGKVNTFASYNFAYREMSNDLVLNRSFYDQENLTKAYLQDNFIKTGVNNHSGKAGLDYQLNDNHILGAAFSFNSNILTPNSNSKTSVMDSEQQLLKEIQTQSDAKNKWRNGSLNLNHRYSLDTLGSEVNTDIDWIHYFNKSVQHFDTKTKTPGQTGTLPYVLRGNVDGGLDIYALKSDAIMIFEQNWKLETGIKSSFVKSDNDMEFYDHSAEKPVLDTGKSNHYIYKEYIHAVYGNLSKKWNRMTAIVGLRAEHTNVTGTQITMDLVNKKKYTQLFPSASLSFDLNEDNRLDINFSRRISRPSYIQLNPFKYYINATTYKTGNPGLNPQTSQNYELTYSLKNKYLATVSYSKTAQNITSVVKPIIENGENISVQTDENISAALYYGLYLVAPVQVTKWWEMNTSANFYYGSYSGNVSETTIKNKGNFNVDLNMVNTIRLGNNYAAELAASYKSAEVYAFARISPLWSLNIGAQKKFSNNSTLKLSFSDIFRTNYYKGLTVYNNYKENFSTKRDTRLAMLSYSYSFGDSKSTKIRKTGGAEDLKRRAE
ncbi:TonB-dependent receptor domain-containing protein [Sphingobacterium thalpophilum]|uniref:TonB-dependent receptor domain-containing protein n=1 Tax=Sphingobacterium thalpophilum TaxID=259 RepID=UPI003C7321A5